MVPISAHALFARPMVVAPDSVLAVEVLARTEGGGVLWCDGRRTVDLPPGARIEVRRGAPAGAAGPAPPGAVHRPAGRQVRPAGRGLARLSGAPPPATPKGRRCLRRSGSARSASSTTLELGPASTWSPVRPAPARPWWSPRSACCSATARTPARSAPAQAARGSKVWSSRQLDGSARRSTRPAARSRTAAWSSRARSPPRAVRGRASGERRCRSSRWPMADPLVAVHGQCDQHRLLRPRAQRDAVDGFAGETCGVKAAYAERRAAEQTERSSPRSSPRPGARARGRRAPVRPRRGRGRRARARRGHRPGGRGGAARVRRHAACGRRVAREALSSEAADPDALGTAAAARTRSSPSATTTRRPASWPTGSPSSPTCWPTWRPTSRRTPPASRPTPPGWCACRSDARR